jgi:hypothetical protein
MTKTGTEITYLDAIREAQAHALRDDPRVFIYGQDVGAFGGAFKATKNLAKEFPGRVLDSPISEDAMVGMAVGAAIATRSSTKPRHFSGARKFPAPSPCGCRSAARPARGRSTARRQKRFTRIIPASSC